MSCTFLMHFCVFMIHFLSLNCSICISWKKYSYRVWNKVRVSEYSFKCISFSFIFLRKSVCLFDQRVHAYWSLNTLLFLSFVLQYHKKIIFGPGLGWTFCLFNRTCFTLLNNGMTVKLPKDVFLFTLYVLETELNMWKLLNCVYYKAHFKWLWFLLVTGCSDAINLSVWFWPCPSCVTVLFAS